MQQRDYSSRQRGGYQDDDRFGDYGRRDQQWQGGQRGVAGGDDGDPYREQSYTQGRGFGEDRSEDRSSYGQFGSGPSSGRQQEAWSTGGSASSGQYGGGQLRGDHGDRQAGRYGSRSRYQSGPYNQPDEQYGRRDLGSGGSMSSDWGRGSQGQWSEGREDEFDPDYQQWRSEQMRGLDEDYRSWRQDRYKKFSEEFDKWRSERGRTASRGESPGQSGSSSGTSSQSASSGASGSTESSSASGKTGTTDSSGSSTRK